jgi:hypothetical protein
MINILTFLANFVEKPLLSLPILLKATSAAMKSIPKAACNWPH